MAPASAYITTPPANDNDILIIRAFYVMHGLAGKIKVDTSKGLMLGAVPRPPSNDPSHKESVGPGMIVYSAIFIATMLLSTITRLSLRARHGKERLGWDDILIAIATVVAIGAPMITIISVHKTGMGKHTFDVTYEEINLHLSLSPVRSLFFYVGLGLVKMSIACFYMRLNGFTSRRWMITHWALLFLAAATTIIAIFFQAIPCRPNIGQFNFKNTGLLNEKPKCINKITILIILNTMHILNDATLMIVPIVMLWRVRMKTSTKFRVWIIGLVGCLNIVFSIVRTVENKLSSASSDPMYKNQFNINILTCLEVTLGVVTASLPALSTPFTNLIRRIKSRLSLYQPHNHLHHTHHQQRDRRFFGGRRHHGVTTVSSLHSLDDKDSSTGFSRATTTVDHDEQGKATMRQMVEEEALARKTTVDGEGGMKDIELMDRESQTTCQALTDHEGDDGRRQGRPAAADAGIEKSKDSGMT